jgi:hypothetical protein
MLAPVVGAAFGVEVELANPGGVDLVCVAEHLFRPTAVLVIDAS